MNLLNKITLVLLILLLMTLKSCENKIKLDLNFIESRTCVIMPTNYTVLSSKLLQVDGWEKTFILKMENNQEIRDLIFLIDKNTCDSEKKEYSDCGCWSLEDSIFYYHTPEKQFLSGHFLFELSLNLNNNELKVIEVVDL